MTSAEHIETAKQFLADSDREFLDGDELQASEKLWGAASHAVMAIAEQRGLPYREPQGTEDSRSDARRPVRRFLPPRGVQHRREVSRELLSRLHGRFPDSRRPPGRPRVHLSRHGTGRGRLAEDRQAVGVPTRFVSLPRIVDLVFSRDSSRDKVTSHTTNAPHRGSLSLICGKDPQGAPRAPNGPMWGRKRRKHSQPVHEGASWMRVIGLAAFIVIAFRHRLR